MSGAVVLAAMPTMASGLDAVRGDPVAAALAGAAILLLAAGAGFALRRWSGRLRTLRSQLLVIAVAAIAAAAVAAWLLADLMILSEEQLGPVLIVLAMTAGIAAVVAAIASTSLGRAAHDLGETVRRIEDGDRSIEVSSARADELGHVARALEGLTLRLAELEAERARHDAERSHMLSSISHDLRSPLAALRAALEALIDGVARDPDRYLRSMQADVDALASLVDDFFLLARIEGGDLALDVGTVDLSECCDEALEALSPSAHQRDLHLELDAVAHVQVRGNASALGRVVRNLVDNAIRHAPAGSTVRVTVGAEGRPVVAVVDAGSGFPVGFAEHAFERWSRADESRSRGTGGAGLGLAIARGLVLAHGGRIWIDPPPGGRVAFELPAA
jgi:signal transduction histidine kinase